MRRVARAGFVRALAAAAAAATLAGVPVNTAAPSRFEYHEPHMGTTVRLVLYAASKAEADAAARAAFNRVKALDAALSDYRSDSELSKVVQRAGVEPVAVGPDLFTLLVESRRLAERTGGAFDVASGALTHLWRSARRLSELPSEERLADARARSGTHLLRLDERARTAFLTVPGAKLDLGGIAKGYTADAAREVLIRRGLRQVLVAVGGDIAAGDPPPGRAGWSVAVEPLKVPGAPSIPSLTLTHAAVSTSGDAEQWMTAEGVRYSHVIDARTGRPLTGRSSTTVVAPHGLDADAWSTALSVLDRDEGLALIEQVAGAAALWMWQEPDGRVRMQTSSRWPGGDCPPSGSQGGLSPPCAVSPEP